MAPSLPTPGTVERWALDYVSATDLATKLALPVVPDRWEVDPPPRRLEAPGRPEELEVVGRAPRSPSRGAIADPRRRAMLLHTFMHHELQAAELMAWALLAFPGEPRAFRRGLLGILGDEVRHMRLYRAHIERLGHRYGDFPVRDWFWQRVPGCATAIEFVALMGMGFEGGNLDHSMRYAEWLEAAGDREGAELQRTIGREEVAHVRFATRWFRRWTGAVEFGEWSRRIVAPLTPTMMRGNVLNRSDRRRAGFPEEFLAALDEASEGASP